MKEIIVPKSPINTSVLDAELRSNLGADYLGLSTRLGDVIVFLEDSASGEVVQEAEAIVLAHDANTLSAEQEAELARQEALATARNAHPLSLDLDDFEASAQDVQTLAGYLAWLELEIRDLRGL
jgi:hypothetical protein